MGPLSPSFSGRESVPRKEGTCAKLVLITVGPDHRAKQEGLDVAVAAAVDAVVVVEDLVMDR